MPDYAACTTAFEANAYIERCLESGLVGVDTETTGTDRWHDELVGICLSAAPGEGRYIPVAHTSEGAPNVDLADIAPLLCHMLVTTPMAMHGAPFDVFILWRALRDHGVADPWLWNVAVDTQVAAQCLGERNEAGSDRSAGLKPLAKKFLGVDRPDFEALFPPKTKRKDRHFEKLDVDLVYTYAAADADDTLSLVPVLRSLIQRADVTWIFESLEMPLLREMLWMEHRGVVVDEMSSHEQEQRALDFAAEVEARVLDYFRERIRSTTIKIERKRQGEIVEVEEELELKDSHLKVILHGEDYLNLPPMGTTATGQISLNEEALVKIASHEPACEWVLEVRGARKAASTYFAGWRKHQVTETVLDAEEALDGAPGEVEVAVIHPNYKQFGTETGRMSSSDPNVQNAPKEQTFGKDVEIPDVDPISVNVRDMIVPRPGHYFLEMDWAQVEARAIAGFAQEPVLLDVFARGIDYHKATYGAMYGVDPNTVSKTDRAEGKTLNYLMGFGGGPELLSEKLGCSMEEAREKLARYWSGLPHYAAWKAQTEEFAKTNRFVQTYFGRKRFLDFGGSGIDEKAARRAYFAALREAVNMPIQGCLPSDTRILTPDGWLPIGEFERGKVWTGEAWATASRVDRGSAERVRLHLSDGRTFDCDVRHRLLGVTESPWPSWVDVMESEGVELVRDTGQEWGLQTRSAEDWYWAGRFIGDGYMNDKVWGFAFGPGQDQDDAKSLLQYLEDRVDQFRGGTNSKTGYSVDYGHYGITKIVGGTKKGRDYWQALGMVPAAGAYEKRIPPEVFTLDRDRREAFITGYFDADGYERESSWKIVSVNHSLLQDTLRLMQTLGMTGRITGPNTNGKTSWFELYRHKTIHALVVERVERLGVVEPMMTLSVDDERHAYSSEGLISKNTCADLLKIMLCKVGPYIRQYLPGIRTVFTTHDSVTFEVPDSYDPHWLIEVLDPVCRFDAGFIDGWPEISCDFEWGDKWGSLTEDDDEDDESSSDDIPAESPNYDIPEPTADNLVLDVGVGLTAEQATELRDFLQGLGSGASTLTILVDDGNSVEWQNVALGAADGHLFAHIIDPEQYRFYAANDLSLVASA